MPLPSAILTLSMLRLILRIGGLIVTRWVLRFRSVSILIVGLAYLGSIRDCGLTRAVGLAVMVLVFIFGGFGADAVLILTVVGGLIILL